MTPIKIVLVGIGWAEITAALLVGHSRYGSERIPRVLATTGWTMMAAAVVA